MSRTLILAGLVFCGMVAQTSSQTPRLNMVMRQKLVASQQVLAAVVTSNWRQLEREAVALREATHKPAWLVLTEPEYVRQTSAFVRSLDALVDAARRKDLEAAPQAYVSMTMNCVQCHRYVARRRIAGSAPEPAHD